MEWLINWTSKRNYAKSCKTFHSQAAKDGASSTRGKTESNIQFPQFKERLNTRELALESILNLVKEQNTSTLEIEFDRKKNRDLSYMAVKAVRLMSVNTLVNFWMDFVMSNSSRIDQLDIHAHTAAMSALNSHHCYDESVKIYQALLVGNRDLDEIAFIAAIRAVGRCQSIETVLSTLDIAYQHIGIKCLSVAITAITNLKYRKDYRTPMYKRQWTPRSECLKATIDRSSHINMITTTHSNKKFYSQNISSNSNHNINHTSVLPMQSMPMQSMQLLLHWVRSKNIPFTLPLLDSALAVASVYGSEHDCSQLLQEMHSSGLRPSIYSYNTLLNHHAERAAAAPAHRLVRQMREAGVMPDITTFNTLLKLSVQLQDAAGAYKVIELMRTLPNIGVDKVTQSLLLRLAKKMNTTVYNNNNNTTTVQPIEKFPIHILISNMLNASTLVTNNSPNVTTTKVFPADMSLSSPINYTKSRFLTANLIESCTDIKTANILLQHAKQNNYDDHVI